MVVMGLTSVTTTDQRPTPTITNSLNSNTNFEKNKPNILFIAVDDMNDWVGYLNGHGRMKIHTPNIDRLARA